MFEGDLADSILLRLGAASLSRCSGTSRLMRRRSGRDSLWLLHHHRLFYKASGVAVPVGCDDEFRGYLERMVAVVRAECEAQGGSAKCTRSGQLRTVYCYRMVEKKKVLKGWDQVCLFLPSGGQLGEGLSDLEIWRIERYFLSVSFCPPPRSPRPPFFSHSPCLSVCWSVCLSICLSVCLSVCLSICLSVYLSSGCLPICRAIEKKRN